MKLFPFLFLCCTLWAGMTSAQKTLPYFIVKQLAKGKTQISWINPHGHDCIQLAVQRSTDSSKDFRTIFSAQSPELPANGYLDTKAPTGIRNYYRIFYVLKGGNYFFSGTQGISDNDINNNQSTAAETKQEMITKKKSTVRRVTVPPALPAGKYMSIYRIGSRVLLLDGKSYKKFRDSIANQTEDTLFVLDKFKIGWRTFSEQPASTDNMVAIYRNDSLLVNLDMPALKKFRDSLATKTKDTLYTVNNRLELHPFLPKYAWKPSTYVFTDDRGYPVIQLPDVKQHRYKIIFFEADGTEVFQIKSVKETELVLEKSNFIHGGWFYFSLFEDDQLKEKNKFFLK